MNDPHVEWVEYDLKTSSSFSFSPETEPKRGTTTLCDWEIRDCVLMCKLVQHFDSEQNARAAIEPWLREWAISFNLPHRQQALKFVFRRARVVDRAALPGSLTLGAASARGQLVVVPPHEELREYPDPPTGFALSLEVEMMWSMYRLYSEGGARLTDMAYWCLKVLEVEGARNRTGTKKEQQRESAEKHYGIERAVLNRIGDHSSRQSPDPQARKYGDETPLTTSEMQWLDAAILACIRRVAEHAAGVPGTLTMKDIDV